ncbi:hypothetical protein TI03_06315, partial [Achromatium sp. WMS1]
ISLTQRRTNDNVAIKPNSSNSLQSPEPRLESYSAISESPIATQKLEGESALSNFPSIEEIENETTGEVDPASEAEIYIAYGRYQQAETLIIQTLDKFPNRLDLKLKLLEVYHTTHNVAAFSSLLEEMNTDDLANSSPQVWADICSMGQELLPGNPLFAGASPDGKTAPQHYADDNDDRDQERTSYVEENYDGLEGNETVMSEMPMDILKKGNVTSLNFNSDLYPEDLRPTGTPEPVTSPANESSTDESLDSMFEPVLEQMDNFNDLSNIGDSEIAEYDSNLGSGLCRLLLLFGLIATLSFVRRCVNDI